MGFVAFNWLLGHVSTARAGTYAYVNPVVAILVGCLLDGEELAGGVVGGITVILAGVALVRGKCQVLPRVRLNHITSPAYQQLSLGADRIDSLSAGPYGKNW